MALTEAEELELLELEEEEARTSRAPYQGPFAKETALQAAKVATMGPVIATQELLQADPGTMVRRGGAAFPIAGGAVGGPVGAMMGELGRQVAGTAFAPETVPKTALGRVASTYAAGIAQEPKILQSIPGMKPVSDMVGKLADRTGQSASKGWSKVTQALTGKPAVKMERLLKDPNVILPESMGGAKSVEKASKQYAEALENAPVHHPEGYVTKGLEKMSFGPFEGGKAKAQKVAQDVYDKWKTGETISAQEAFDAKRATDKIWPTVIKDRNVEDIRELSEFKTAMDDVLSRQSGVLQKASSDYARAKLKEDWTQIFPRTKTGDISTVKTLLLQALTPRGVGMVAGGATSPLVVGTASAATMKGLNVLGQNPAVRQVLLDSLKRIIANQESK